MIGQSPESGRRGVREAVSSSASLLRGMLESLGAGTKRAWEAFRDSTPPLTAAPPPVLCPLGANDLVLRAVCAESPAGVSRGISTAVEIDDREVYDTSARRVEEESNLATLFAFYTSIKLPEYEGRKAGTVRELLDGIRTVDGSSIFHHTFHFLYQTQHVIAQPPSDFAYWVEVVLLDHELAERLGAVNPVEFSTIRALRERLIAVIEEHLSNHDCTARAPGNMDFFFMRANSLVVKTPFFATDLPSFRDALQKISIGSLYHHLFESRMKPGVRRNDFSDWLEGLGLVTLAKQIERLDPFLFTLEEIRSRLLAIVKAVA